MTARRTIRGLGRLAKGVPGGARLRDLVVRGRRNRRWRGAQDDARLRDHLDPARSALIVVDVQNDFAHPDGRVAAGRGPARPAAVVAAINRLIDAARWAGVAVVYTRTEHGPGLDLAPYAAAFERRRRDAADGICLAGTWGAELVAQLAPPSVDDLIITKHGYDAFAVPELPDRLRAEGRATVVVTGFATTLCVAATVAGAFERGFLPIVPREATGATDDAAREAALRHIDRYYGEVVALPLVLDAWR